MSSRNYLGRFLEKIAIFSSENPIKVLTVFSLLTIGAAFIAKGIQIDPALQSLIPQDRPVVKEFVAIEDDFQPTEIMISVVELPPDLPVIRYRKFIRQYQARLEEIPELDAGRLSINSKFIGQVIAYMQQHGMRLMDPEALSEFNGLLGPQSLQTKLSGADPYRLYLGEMEFDPLDVLPLIHGLIPLGDRASLDRSNEFFITRDPHTLFFVVGNDLPWLWDRTKKIVTQAAKIEKEVWDEVMPQIRKLNEGQVIPYPKITWIGKAMDVWRMTDVIWDGFSGTILWTSILVAGVFLLFIPSFRALFLAYIPVIFGLIWSVAFARLAVGKLNMLSVIIWGMLIGLGIDYPTFLLNRYFHLRQNGVAMQEALRTTWRQTGRPVAIGALNVIVVFAILLASRLPAFRDIGLISCSGLFITLALVLITLPALIRLTEGRRIPRAMLGYPETLVQIPLRRPWLTMLLCLLIFGGMTLFITRFRFQSAFEETYFMFRQPAELTSPTDQRFGSLLGSSLTPFRLVVTGNSWQEALERNEALAQLLKKYQGAKEIAYFDSLYYFLPSQKRQEANQKIIPELKNLVPDTFSERYEQVTEVLWPDRNISRLHKQGFRSYGPKIEKFLGGIFPTDLEILQSSGLEKILKHYYVGKNQKIMLSTYVYLPRGYFPQLKESLMNHLLQEEMFRDGTVRYSSEEAMIGEVRNVLIDDLYRLGTLSLAVTTVLLLIAFRSLKITLFASIPMILGGAAAVGAYTWIRGTFSIFNILWVPIYIGMSTDDVLHIGTHVVQEKSSIADAVRKSGSIVILTSLTTMIGFGSSLFTDIEILKRISIWIVVALGAELLASLFFFPALLQISRKSGTLIASKT